MKRSISIVAALMAAACVYAAQDTALDGMAEVRDPVRLKVWLEANAGDAETRIAAVESGVQGSTATLGALTVSTNLIVGGTASVGGASTLSGAVTVIGGSVTSRWDDASSKIDGEQIAADTIDDDSIDFGDVTGADLTLTDCGPITSSGAVQGATLALSATQWFDVIDTTQLVFISAGVTNIIDADITTP